MINLDNYPEKDESVWADEELTSEQEDLILARKNE